MQSLKLHTLYVIFLSYLFGSCTSNKKSTFKLDESSILSDMTITSLESESKFETEEYKCTSENIGKIVFSRDTSKYYRCETYAEGKKIKEKYIELNVNKVPEDIIQVIIDNTDQTSIEIKKESDGTIEEVIIKGADGSEQIIPIKKQETVVEALNNRISELEENRSTSSGNEEQIQELTRLRQSISQLSLNEQAGQAKNFNLRPNKELNLGVEHKLAENLDASEYKRTIEIRFKGFLQQKFSLNNGSHDFSNEIQKNTMDIKELENASFLQMIELSENKFIILYKDTNDNQFRYRVFDRYFSGFDNVHKLQDISPDNQRVRLLKINKDRFVIAFIDASNKKLNLILYDLDKENKAQEIKKIEQELTASNNQYIFDAASTQDENFLYLAFNYDNNFLLKKFSIQGNDFTELEKEEIDKTNPKAICIVKDKNNQVKYFSEIEPQLIISYLTSGVVFNKRYEKAITKDNALYTLEPSTASMTNDTISHDDYFCGIYKDGFYISSKNTKTYVYKEFVQINASKSQWDRSDVNKSTKFAFSFDKEKDVYMVRSDHQLYKEENEASQLSKEKNLEDAFFLPLKEYSNQVFLIEKQTDPNSFKLHRLYNMKNKQTVSYDEDSQKISNNTQEDIEIIARWQKK